MIFNYEEYSERKASMHMWNEKDSKTLHLKKQSDRRNKKTDGFG